MKGPECRGCSIFRHLCARLESLPFYVEVRIPRSLMPKMPRCFEETVLGELKGALKQYRGPNGSHVLEYGTEWVVHRDKIDPRIDPLGHLVNDAPHIIIGGIFIASLFLMMIAAGGGED